MHRKASSIVLKDLPKSLLSGTSHFRLNPAALPWTPTRNATTTAATTTQSSSPILSTHESLRPIAVLIPPKKTSSGPLSERARRFAGDADSQSSANYGGARDLMPGDYVELRSGRWYDDAMVVTTAPNRSATLILSNGEVLVDISPNRMGICIPGIFPAELAQPLLPIPEESRTPEQEEAFQKARLELVQIMRKHQVESKKVMHRVHQVAHGPLYNHFRTPKLQDPDDWTSVTMGEAYQFVLKRLGAKASSFPNYLIQVATWRYLAEQSEYFIIDSARADRLFVAPPMAIQNLHLVNEWARTNDPRLRAFISKARKIMEAGDKVPRDTATSQAITPVTLPYEFSKSDKRILFLLRDSMERTRTTQWDPSQESLSAIARALGFPFDTSAKFAHDLLSRIGAVPGWQDWTFMDREALTRKRLDGHKSFHQIPPKLSDLSSAKPNGYEDGVGHIRHDWGELPVYVIDDSSAEELDDGISVEPAEEGCQWIHVHIADPTAILRPNDSLAVAAKQRQITLYYVDKSFSLFHPSFTGHFSLGSRPAQPVLTFSAKIGPDGAILESSVKPGIVRNVHIVSYSAIDATMGQVPKPTELQRLFPDSYNTIQSPPAPSAYDNHIRIMHAVAQTLHRNRIRNGAYEIEYTVRPQCMPRPKNLPAIPFVPEQPVFFSGFPEIIVTEHHGTMNNKHSARNMVAEYALLANRVAAKFGADNNVDLIHRYHNIPEKKTLLDPLRHPETGVIEWNIVLMGMNASSGLSVEPRGNDLLGMGDDPYVRATSPLRRFSDLINHWQIKAKLAGRAPTFSRAEMEVMAQEIYPIEKEAGRRMAHNNEYWASLKIKRAFDAEPNKFKSLHGWITDEAKADPTVADRTWVREAFIPALSLSVVIKGLERVEAHTLQMGQHLSLDLQEVKMSKYPELRCSLSRHEPSS